MAAVGETASEDKDASSSSSSADSASTLTPTSPYTRIDLGDVTPHNLKLLKKINQVRVKTY